MLASAAKSAIREYAFEIESYKYIVSYNIWINKIYFSNNNLITYNKYDIRQY